MNLYKNLEWQKSHPDMKIVATLDYDSDYIWEIPALGGERTDLPFYIQEVGITIGKKNYYVCRENFDSIMVGYVESGAMDCEYHGKERFEAGDAYWIDCREPHIYKNAAEYDSFKTIFIHCWGEGAKAFTGLFKSLYPQGSIACGENSMIPYYLNHILRLYHKNPGDHLTDYKASTYISELMLAILELTEIQLGKNKPDYIQKICTYFDNFFFQNITLKDLSEKYAISESYLQKQFKNYVGISPNNYLTMIRIKNSKQLLRTTQFSVAEIAEKVGFKDTSYFIAVFKKHESVTPLEYRKLWSFAKPK